MIYGIKCVPEEMSSKHIFAHLRTNNMKPVYAHCGAEPDEGCDEFLDTRNEGDRFIYIKYEDAVSDTADLKTKVVEAINSYVPES
jgi:hypothetical protein